jgi:tetratricopeptide (TPR) repeat protein
LWSYYLSRCDFANVLLMAERLVRLGNEGADLRGQILGHLCAGSALALRGDLTEARSRLELTIDLCESSYADPNLAWDQLSSPNALANAHTHLARVLCWMGYLDQALAHTSAADTEVDRGRFSVAGVAYFRLQRLRLFAHFFEPSELVEATDEVLRLNRELVVPYHVANAKIYKGYVVAHSDDPSAGGGMISEGLAEYKATNAIVFSGYYLALLAETLHMRGDTDAALTALTEALSATERSSERWCEADLLRRIGEAHLAKHDPAAAERHFTQALGIARSQSAKLFELRAATSMARLWCDQGKSAEAHELLAPVFAWFTEGFATPDLKRAQALLDRLALPPA